jgi:hypothetical protein
MSLTIFIHSKNRSVGIVRWFMEPKGLLSYASGPVIEMTSDQFRSTGYDWIHRHFAEFARIRVCDEHRVRPFAKKEGKRYMEDRDVVEIRSQPGVDFLFLPCVVRQYNLGRGLEMLEREKRRTIPVDSSPEIFWQTFDEALSFSHWYSV